jgi:hypothetical protein
VHGTGAARHYDAGAETGAAATPEDAAAWTQTAAAASGWACSVSSPDSPVRMR